MDREDFDLGVGHPAFDGAEMPEDVCPRCGHSADDHDLDGCAVCDCPGP